MNEAVIKGALSGVVLAELALFSWWFNRKIDQMHDRLDGFTWLTVAIGTAVTLLGIGLLDLLLDWNAGLIGLAAFAASGTCMIAGAVARYMQRRQRLIEQVRNDAQETLAE